MLKSITLENFQSHKDTKLTLSPGVNFVVGQSDSGKTAIIRALKWLATNRPSGDAFKSWWGGDTLVKVEFDGKNIVHQKGFYSLTDKVESIGWQAIGTSVPESVTQALNISELSWQGQLDPPFLLSASPGEVARTLNEVADLNKIDDALANINRMVRDNRTILTEAVQQERQVEMELSQYRDVDYQVKKVKGLTDKQKKADAIREYINNGEYILDLIGEVTEEQKQVKDMTAAEDQLDILMNMTGERDELRDRIGKIQQVISDTQNALAQDFIYEKDQKALEVIWQKEFPKTCPLCGYSPTK